MTREEFAKAMLVLQAGIGREFNGPTMEVWFRILSDLDATDCGYAVDRYLAECPSGFPTPAQLRIFVDELRHGEPLDHSRAWAAVLSVLRTLAERTSLDEITLAAVERIGGWRMLTHIRCDQLPTLLAQFRTAYQSEQKRILRDRRLPEALRPVIAHERHRQIEVQSASRESAKIAECPDASRDRKRMEAR